MAKRKHTAERIIGKLREAEVLLVQGRTLTRRATAHAAHEPGAPGSPPLTGARGAFARAGRSGPGLRTFRGCPAGLPSSTVRAGDRGSDRRRIAGSAASWKG
jgi:hypothetical protein